MGNAFDDAKLIEDPNETLYTPHTGITNTGDFRITTITETNSNNTKRITIITVDNRTNTTTISVDDDNNKDVYINGKIIPHTQSKTPIKAPYITDNVAINNDKKFLHKLASMLKTCKKPCNYFKPMSSSIGTLADFGRALSDSASVLGATLSDAMHAPVNIATDTLNKIKPMVRTEFFKLKIMTQDLYRDGVKPFFSPQDRQRVKDQLAQGITPDTKFNRLPLTGDSKTYFSASKTYSKFQSHLQLQLGDCYRMHDYNQRYNPYDPTMNAAYAKRKFMGVKNGDVKSLVDITGSPAPAQYATENTYVNALDVPKDPDLLRHEDIKKAPKYDTYDGPSKGSEATVTAGQAPINPAEASGSMPAAGAGLENVPANGKVYNYDYGEVKLTQYGYKNDECPDTGSEMGFGSRLNMIIPLKTVALSPQNLPGKKGNGQFKPGDILIITCTDKKGNTWVERRQVGDAAGAGVINSGGHYKLVIDEFTPNKKNHGSKLVDRSKELKLSIQIADTKEPLAKWNIQEAGQFAPIFLSRSDWERAIKFGPKSDDAKIRSVAAAMKAGEYDQYKKFSPDEPLLPKIVNNAGCT